MNIVKRFGDVIAVDRVNLDIMDGEFFCLLGPSGSGKTTLLRLIAGLEYPTEGEIYIDYRLVNDVHPKDRDVAMVFQNYALYPHMRVFDNIAFPLMMRRRQLGLTKDEIKRRVLEVARMLRIEHLLNRKPSQLSGGEQQRVALARALVRQPKVFLMDEPLSNLDAKLRLYMRTELRRLQRKLGVTTIYVTHDQVEAMSMADRIAIINKGRVQQVGTPDELYNKPANIFVAGFIGIPPMNLIPCKVEKENKKFTLKCGELIKQLDEEIAKVIEEHDYGPEIILGIRPEHMSVSREPVNGAIRTEVLLSEPLGSEVIVNVKIGETVVKVRAPPGVRYDMGEKVYLVINWSKIHIFDRETEKAII